MTLAHDVVFDVFINPFTFQEMKIRGQSEMKKSWLEINQKTKHTQIELG